MVRVPLCNQQTRATEAQARQTSQITTWLNKDVMELMAERDKLKKEKRFSEYKKLRKKKRKKEEKKNR